MKIFLRQRGNVLAEADLEPGRTYLLGRAKDCEIRVALSFISRQHARLYESEGSWWYQDLRNEAKTPPLPLNAERAVSVEKGCDLVTEAYVSMQKTSQIDLNSEEFSQEDLRTRWKMLKYAAMFGIPLMIAGGLGGYQVYRKFFSPLDANELLTSVRPQVVEFEMERDEEAIAQLKQYAKLKDEDFRDSVGFCSGFIVAKDIVLTASHCVLGPFGSDIREDFKIKTHDEKRHRPTRLLGFDLKRDYLFLEVPGIGSDGVLDFEPHYKIGEKVYTVGNVHGEGIAIREGITASKTKDEADPSIEFLRYSAAASPGNSGGPLLNAYKKVVGLVFARGGYSENYNKATDAGDLTAGMSRYVSDQSPKKIAMEFSKIPGLKAADLLYLFRLIDSDLLGGGDLDLLYDQPEQLQPLKEVRVEIEVPAPLEGFADSTQKILQAAFKDKLDLARQNAAKAMPASPDSPTSDDPLKPLPIAKDWTAQANPETPLILPSPQYDRMSIIEAGPQAFLEERFWLYLPADSYGYRAFQAGLKEYQEYHYDASELTAELKKATGERPQGPVFYSSHGGGKKKDVGSFRTDHPFLYASLDFTMPSDWEAKRRPAEAERKRILLGDDGLRVSRLRNPFLKADLIGGLTLGDLPPAAVTEAQDPSGRKWSRASWKLFGEFSIDQYCLSLPEGYACLSTANPLGTPDRFVDKTLSQVMVRPQFWHLPALLDYSKQGHAKNLQALEDVEFSETETGGLEIKFRTIGIAFSLPASERPAMIRIVPALYHQNGQSRWLAVGFTGYYPGPEKNSMKFCGADIQMQGFPAYLDSERSSQRNAEYAHSMKEVLALVPAMEAIRPDLTIKKPGPVLAAKTFQAPSLNREARLITYCQGVSKGPEKFQFGDYENHAYAYRLP